MILTILLILITLIALMALHEFGHFLLAKKFGVRVEEFGIGYPPKIFGKQFGETVYSLNLLPFGAFVKITGQEEIVDDFRSFSQKSIWQRALILFAGVFSFWVVAVVLLAFICGIWGVPTAIEDNFGGNFKQAYVQIVVVAPESPAESAGIKTGDIIKEIKNERLKIKNTTNDKIEGVQSFVDLNKGETLNFQVQRGKKILDISLIPRSSPPEGEGPIGVALVRAANLKYAWYEAPWQALKITAQQTKTIPVVLYDALKRKIQGQRVAELEFRGPIGIGQMMGQAMERGFGNFLTFVSMIAIWMALFNLFPIPALDGGQLLFLVIELVRQKPIPKQIEQKISSVFFTLLVFLMVFVSIKDIIRFF